MTSDGGRLRLNDFSYCVFRHLTAIVLYCNSIQNQTAFVHQKLPHILLMISNKR